MLYWRQADNDKITRENAMNDGGTTQGVTAAPGSATAFWPQGWWRIVDAKIGIVP